MGITTVFGNRPYLSQYIFSGKVYQCSIRHQIAKNNGTASFLVRVGQIDDSSEKRLVHIINRESQVEGGGYYDVEIFESPTITDVGTQVQYETSSSIGSFSNLNRQSSIKQNSICEIYSNPTFTGGLKYDYEFIPVGGGKGDTGEYNSADSERILNPNTDYIVKFINTSTIADGIIHTSMAWYESGE